MGSRRVGRRSGCAQAEDAPDRPPDRALALIRLPLQVFAQVKRLFELYRTNRKDGHRHQSRHGVGAARETCNPWK